MNRRRLGLRKRLALDIFADLHAATVREHRLDTLFWECTLRCNLSCRHCGSDCRVDPVSAFQPLSGKNSAEESSSLYTASQVAPSGPSVST